MEKVKYEPPRMDADGKPIFESERINKEVDGMMLNSSLLAVGSLATTIALIEIEKAGLTKEAELLRATLNEWENLQLRTLNILRYISDCAGGKGEDGKAEEPEYKIMEE